MLSDRQKGVLCVLFGILCVSPDAVFLRMLSDKGVTLPVILFWKSLCKALIISSFIGVTHGVSETVRDISYGPKHVIAGCFFQTCMEFGFTSMFVFTTTARALLFYSLNPLWSALMGRIALGDPVRCHTIITLVAAFVSVMITFGSQVIMKSEAEEGSSILGDFIAIGTGLSTSAFISTVRSAMKTDNKIFMQPCCVGGTTMATLTSLVFLLVQNKPIALTHDRSFIYPIVFVDAMLVAVMPIALTIAGKVLLGAEVSLITLLQSIVGPFLMFLIFREIPNIWTMGGGLLLLLSIVFHEVYAMKFLKKPSKQLSSPSVSPEERLIVATPTDVNSGVIAVPVVSKSSSANKVETNKILKQSSPHQQGNVFDVSNEECKEDLESGIGLIDRGGGREGIELVACNGGKDVAQGTSLDG